jgi:hypothetical protein
MRRSRASAGQPKPTRSGVTVSTSTRKRNVQSPSDRISASAGLAPSWLLNAAQTSQQKGRQASTKPTGLA